MKAPNLIPVDSQHMSDAYQGDTVKKTYEFGRRGRAPYATVTIYANGCADVLMGNTGKLYVAKPEGVAEAFALARRTSQTCKNRDYAAGW